MWILTRPARSNSLQEVSSPGGNFSISGGKIELVFSGSWKEVSGGMA
jgi:hypothetical protein